MNNAAEIEVTLFGEKADARLIAIFAEEKRARLKSVAVAKRL